MKELVDHVMRGLEKRRFSTFFGEEEKEKAVELLSMPGRPNILEIDKRTADTVLRFSILTRPWDKDNPVPAMMVTNDKGNGQWDELFINTPMSFVRAANLAEGRAVVKDIQWQDPNDAIWLRAAFDERVNGIAAIKMVEGYPKQGRKELHDLLGLVPHENKMNVFEKALILMKLRDGDMPEVDAGKLGKLYLSAEPEIKSISLWDPMKKLLVRDIKNTQEMQKVFGPELNAQIDERLKAEKGLKPKKRNNLGL